VAEVDDEPTTVTPTLWGRLQTRVFALATVGVLATLLITPVLPRPAGAGLGDAYEVAFRVLITVAVLGLGWELVYHFIQQFRWEKDWPSLYALLCGINEAVLIWLLLKLDALPWLRESEGPGFTAFLVHFTFVWLVVWLFLNGPIKVLFVRWRFRGGEIL
jgi:hypothetical protein